MNNKMILESIDEVLNRLDSISDEALQAKYENHKCGPVGRVFLESEEFIAFMMNQTLEEHLAPVNDSSYSQLIEINKNLIKPFKRVSVTNDDVYMLAV